MNWYDTLPTVIGEVECGSAMHRLRWRKGTLEALDHDLEAERAVVSLGGEPPACIQFLDAWRNSQDDLRLLPGFLDERGAKDRQNLEEMVRIMENLAGRRTRGGQSGPFRDDAEEFRSMLRLHYLPRELRRRLEIEMVVRCERRWADPEFRGRAQGFVEVLLSGRANPLIEQSMRAWRRISAGALLTVETWLIEPESEPALAGWIGPDGGFAAASLSVSWLSRVYAAGIACIDGCFVLDAHQVTLESWLATAVRWERQRTDFGDRSTPVTGQVEITRSREGHTLRWQES